MSQYRDAELGTSWTNVFYGTIQNDFTVDGHWGDVPHTPEAEMGNGEITLHIDFDTSGEEFPPPDDDPPDGRLRRTAFVPVDELRRPLMSKARSAATSTIFSRPDACGSSPGDQRYKLIGDGGWSIRGDPPLRVEDERGRVVAREGDPIRVNGFVSRLR